MIKWLLVVMAVGIALLLWRVVAFAKRNLPEAGDAVPLFSLPDQNGKLRTGSEFLGKWLVVYFYPRDDTPGCTEQAARYRDAMSDLEALGAAVCGISVDSSASHADFARKYNLSYALLADSNGETAGRFGSLLNLGIVKFARRNTFLVDPRGKVVKIYLGVNPAKNAREVIDDLKRLAAA